MFCEEINIFGEDDYSICRIKNPDIPRMGRVGAPSGTAGRGWAGLGANRTIRPGNKSSVYPPRIAETSLERLLRKTKKRNSI